MKRLYSIFNSLFFDYIAVINKYRALPYFLRNMMQYNRLNQDKGLRFHLKNIFYKAEDRFGEAGSISGHYFYQDLWAAKYLYEHKIIDHVDVGSRLDGFIAHILLFSKVCYVDVRPLKAEIKGLDFKQGSVLSLPFQDNSIQSLSCLHVIEHVGLGRYGDLVDPEGYIKAAKELIRVLGYGGTLLISVPVGRMRLCFDAHRIFDPQVIVNIFSELKLQEFLLIDDNNKILSNASFDDARNCNYGCGLFVFKK